jgi:hypothetical protein
MVHLNVCLYSEVNASFQDGGKYQNLPLGVHDAGVFEYLSVSQPFAFTPSHQAVLACGTSSDKGCDIEDFCRCVYDDYDVLQAVEKSKHGTELSEENSNNSWFSAVEDNNVSVVKDMLHKGFKINALNRVSEPRIEYLLLFVLESNLV